MNSCLFWRRPEDFNQWKHYIWHLVKGIRLLDKVTTTVYRGIYRSNFALELYKSGKRVVWNSITSCSQIESRAKSFFMKVDEFSFSHNSHITFHFLQTTTTTHFVEKQDPSKGVFFSIKVSDGHKLGNLSAFPQEQEVLLEPGSEFVVTDSVCFNETWVVNLEQTPSTNAIVLGLFVGLFLCCLFNCCDFFFLGLFFSVFSPVHRPFC